VREACHGVEALERLEEGPADVIILDLMMPEMDGFAVVEHLRRDPRWSGIPVVIASAMELSEADRRQLRSRVAAVYRKGSLSLVELSASLARLAKKRNQAEAGPRR
jgi:CheY-like chemotaxis protein